MTSSGLSARQLISQRALTLGRRFQPTIRALFVEDRGNPALVASCVLLRIDTTLFMLTAAHVLDMRERGLDLLASTGLVRLSGDFVFSTIQEGQHRDSDRTDVGIVRLSNSVSKSLADLAVLTPSDLDVEDIAVGGKSRRPAYVLLGFPATRAKIRRTEKRITCKGIVLTAFAARVETYQRLAVHDETHIVLEFDPSDVTDADGRTHPPGLKGVSGGGIWRAGRPLDVEGLDAKLVAIIIEWHRRSVKAVLGVRLALFREVIRRHFPELSRHIPLSTRVRITPHLSPR